MRARVEGRGQRTHAGRVCLTRAWYVAHALFVIIGHGIVQCHAASQAGKGYTCAGVESRGQWTYGWRVSFTRACK
eukprot:5672710-Karenia_brevis.AAC.1